MVLPHETSVFPRASRLVLPVQLHTPLDHAWSVEAVNAAAQGDQVRAVALNGPVCLTASAAKNAVDSCEVRNVEEIEH